VVEVHVGGGTPSLVPPKFYGELLARLSEFFRILGTHIVGPEASILIQEVVTLMYTHEGSAEPIYNGMHIHPALSEVVERAFYHLHEPGEWRRHLCAR